MGNEMINNPIHYGGKENVYETIKVIDNWELDFLLGNVIKYISRAGKKDPTKKHTRTNIQTELNPTMKIQKSGSKKGMSQNKI